MMSPPVESELDSEMIMCAQNRNLKIRYIAAIKKGNCLGTKIHTCLQC